MLTRLLYVISDCPASGNDYIISFIMGRKDLLRAGVVEPYKVRIFASTVGCRPTVSSSYLV